MMEEKCEWAFIRNQKLLRCVYKPVQTVNIEGRTLYLCSTHASTITRLLARQEKLDRDYARISQEIAVEKQRIVESYDELKRKEQTSSP
jgi:hypothetical protein